MPDFPLADRSEFDVRAMLVGERIDVRKLPPIDRIATNPTVVAPEGGGVAVLFRFGAVVLFDVARDDESRVLEQLGPAILQPVARPEREAVPARIDPGAKEGWSDEAVILADATVGRLQVVADILAKSVVLSWYETSAAENFDRIEPVALALQRKGRVGRRARGLVRHIGASLLSEHRMVGRAEVGEKPELLWEHPELEGLYMRLEDTFEIRERDAALNRKLELIARTAQTVLELIHTKRSLRVEWYIVILIVVEIVLTVYEMFIRGH